MISVKGGGSISLGGIQAPQPGTPAPEVLSATLTPIGPRTVGYSTAPISSGLTRRSAGAAAANTYMATKQQTVAQAIGTAPVSGGAAIRGGAVRMTAPPPPKAYQGMAPIPGGASYAPAEAPPPEGTYYEDETQTAQPSQDGQYYEDAPSGYVDDGQGYYEEEQGPSYMVPVQTSLNRDATRTESIGFFRRIWNWLTGKKTSPQMAGESMSLPQIAASLVERARLGDQNAMAMIAACSLNAKRGNERAQTACAHIERYITHNPVIQTHKTLSPYDQAQVNAQSLRMAEGELLTDDRIRGMQSAFGSEYERQRFAHGVNHHENGRVYPHAPAAENLGRTVGYARGLQVIQLPGARVSDFSPTVGWELGE